MCRVKVGFGRVDYQGNFVSIAKTGSPSADSSTSAVGARRDPRFPRGSRRRSAWHATIVKRLPKRLQNRFLLWLATVLAVSSAAFGVLFVALYQREIAQERERGLLEMNRLLQSALENAMLKQDLDGLRGIVDRLGRQPGMRAALIINPDREVRFSSERDRLGTRLSPESLGLCRECTRTPIVDYAPTTLVLSIDGADVLRSVRPVFNQPVCAPCHGPASVRPINGLLVADYDAAPLRRSALESAAAFLGAGILVMAIVLASAWWFVRRRVLIPIAELDRSSRALAAGDLSARASVRGTDELARLGESFNEMAASLDRGLKALERRRAELQTLIDAIPDGIRVIDRRFEIVLANSAFERMHGLERGGAVGRKCYEASHGRREPCPSTLQTCPVAELAAGGEPLRLIARHAKASSTEPIDVEVYASAVGAPDEHPGGPWVVEAIRDLKQDVRFSHEQRLSELGRLATGVAHEIHNPLAALRIASQAARRSTAGATIDVEDLRHYLGIVDSEIDRCVGVTEKLMKLAMPAGKPQLVDVNHAIRETLALLAWEARESGVDVVEALAADAPRVLAIDSDVRMLVLNLAQNAFHALPRGGRLRVSTSVEAEQVRIDVEDNGVGIAPEDRDRIFEPFFSRRANGMPGTGLGLPICRAIVEAVGGSIGVRSEPGVGTTFTIRLPEAK